MWQVNLVTLQCIHFDKSLSLPEAAWIHQVGKTGKILYCVASSMVCVFCVVFFLPFEKFNLVFVEVGNILYCLTREHTLLQCQSNGLHCWSIFFPFWISLFSTAIFLKGISMVFRCFFFHFWNMLPLKIRLMLIILIFILIQYLIWQLYKYKYHVKTMNC